MNCEIAELPPIAKLSVVYFSKNSEASFRCVDFPRLWASNGENLVSFSHSDYDGEDRINGAAGISESAGGQLYASVVVM